MQIIKVSFCKKNITCDLFHDNFTFFLYEQYGYPEKREVRQFQFTAWPDHGVPDHPTPLLMFMKRVKTSNPLDGGPMIVHCR